MQPREVWKKSALHPFNRSTLPSALHRECCFCGEASRVKTRQVVQRKGLGAQKGRRACQHGRGRVRGGRRRGARSPSGAAGGRRSRGTMRGKCGREETMRSFYPPALHSDIIRQFGHPSLVSAALEIDGPWYKSAKLARSKCFTSA